MNNLIGTRKERQIEGKENRKGEYIETRGHIKTPKRGKYGQN